MSSEHATYRRRAGFLSHHLWCTKYHPDELYPSGTFPNQDPEGDGVDKWVFRREESIWNEDLVVWFVFGVNHLPRLEDWPVMPRDITKITIRPRFVPSLTLFP